MTQGYLLIALGRQYIHESKLFLDTLRKVGDTRPVSLLIHPDDTEYAQSLNVFDRLILFTPNNQIWNDCTTSFEKYCLYPRLHLMGYLVYDETIVVDSDVLVQSNPEHVWNYLSNQPIPVRMLGRVNDPSWHWGHIDDVSAAYKKKVPHVHGGFFYLRNTVQIDGFFNYAMEVFYRYDEYHCQRAFRGGKVDEILFAITHAYFNLNPIEFDEYPIMTFNYMPFLMIPSKLQTEGGQNKLMQDYPPFVHMFDKMQSNSFKILYGKIMNYV